MSVHHRDFYTSVFIVSVFTVSGKRTQPTCPSAGRVDIEKCGPHTQGNIFSCKGKEIMAFVEKIDGPRNHLELTKPE